MIPIVLALKSETNNLDVLSETIGELERFSLAFAGAGKQNVLEKLRSLESEASLEGVVSAGFAGSLRPELEGGRLFLVDKLTSAEEGFPDLSSDRDWRSIAARKLGAGMEENRLVSAKAEASTPEEKRNLRREYGADLVDRESYWAASFAEGKEVPFLGLRVVFDGPDRSLPPYGESKNGEMKMEWIKLFSWVFEDPSRILDLTKLYRKRKKCGKVLTTSLIRLAEGGSDRLS